MDTEQGSDTRGHDRLRTTAAGSIRHPSQPRRRRGTACSGSTTCPTRCARPGLHCAVHAPPTSSIVGGGYTGLWTALLASERDPGRRVVLVEARTRRVGGLGPQRRVLRGEPDPRPRERAVAAGPTRCRSSTGSGMANLDGMGDEARYGIDFHWERTGSSPSRPSRTSSSGSTSGQRMTRAMTVYLDEAARCRHPSHSPTFLAAVWEKRNCGARAPGQARRRSSRAPSEERGRRDLRALAGARSRRRTGRASSCGPRTGTSTPPAPSWRRTSSRRCSSATAS